MPTQYNGQPGLITYAATTAIVSSSFATPISIQSNAHGLTTGDKVDVTGHTLNTNANGVWVVTVTDVNNFTLNTSAGTVAGGATGSVQSLAFPKFTIPSDGDAKSAASVNVGMKSGGGDRASALLVATGAMKLVSIGQQGRSDNAMTGWTESATGTNAGARIRTPALAPIVWTMPSAISIPSGSAGPGVVAGDYFEIQLDATASQLTASVNAQLWYALYAPGVAPVPTKIVGSSKRLLFNTQVTQWAITLDGSVLVPAGSPTGFLDVYIYVQDSGGTGQLGYIGDYNMTIRQWRATGVPQ